MNNEKQNQNEVITEQELMEITEEICELEQRAQEDETIRRFLDEIDLLIDGPYVEELDQNRMAVGSENQRILQLTDRYRDVAEAYYGKEERRVEIRLFDGKGMLVGVPAHEQKILWKKLIEK